MNRFDKQMAEFLRQKANKHMYFGRTPKEVGKVNSKIKQLDGLIESLEKMKGEFEEQEVQEREESPLLGAYNSELRELTKEMYVIAAEPDHFPLENGVCLISVLGDDSLKACVSSSIGGMQLFKAILGAVETLLKCIGPNQYAMAMAMLLDLDLKGGSDGH